MTTPRTLSCVLCQKRKVKCDRNDPCAGCVKLGVECIASVPAPPRPRKRITDLQSRLERCEEALKVQGARPETGDSSTTVPVSHGIGEGKLVIDQGKSRFVDKYVASQANPKHVEVYWLLTLFSALWMGLSDEV